MKLSTREDIEAPVEFVYRMLTDVDHWERAALRRGAEVTREDELPGLSPGMAWRIGFGFRGKMRRVTLRLTELDPQHRLAFAGAGEMVSGAMSLDLVSMGPKRSRLMAAIEVKPQTLTARLFLQTLSLAKARMTRRLEMRLAQLSADIEDRYRRSLSR
ncbi:MAG: SRPBCC family protein [Gemmobacter sp.]